MLSEPQHLQVPVASGSDQKLLGELLFENVALWSKDLHLGLRDL